MQQDPARASTRLSLKKKSLNATVSSTQLRSRARRRLIDPDALVLALLLALVEPPHAPGLLGLYSLAAGFGQPLEDVVGVPLQLAEEAPLPLAALGLLFPPQLPLRVFDFGFLDVHNVHVAFLDAGRDGLPCAVGLVGVLLVDGGDDEGGGSGRFGVVGVDGFGRVFLQAGPAAGFDREAVGPLAFDCVEYLFLSANGRQGCGEAILFARDPAFSRVVYLGDVAGGGGDVSAAVQFDKGFAVDEAFDMEGR